jgi:RNA polymerase sigma-70 factor (ECF subfamily)
MEIEAERARLIAPAHHARAPVRSDPDADLVAAAQADPAHFRDLYHRYFRRIHGYVRLRLRDRATCEDVTSQVFLSALAQIANFRGDGSFAAWLFRIAQHAVQRALQAQERLAPPCDAPAQDPMAELPDSAPGPEEHLLVNERREELRALLATLEPAQQHALALRFGAGLSTAEVARLLGKSPVATRVMLHRTLLQLRRRYAREP